MKVVLDASVALGWIFERASLHERQLVDRLLDPSLGWQAFMRGLAAGLTAYDSCYLDLALRRGAILASFDRQLLAAARQAGVPLVE